MKFILFLFPSIPATPEERRVLRPIAQRTHKFQQMLNEAREIARVCEDLGFDTLSTTEHHLHEEGLEMGCTSSFHHFLASHTNHIRVGPVGYVLPSWNPLRLAVETAWLDQLTRGRAIVGMARGYQTRWFQNMAQKYGSELSRSERATTGSPGVAMSESDDVNRALFEEVFEILQLAWKDEPFAFKGRFWQYPSPEGGTPWPGAPWTEKYGTPGIVEDGKLGKLNVVPKPFQKPHPQLFTAFSSSEATLRWAAARGVVPTVTMTGLADFKQKTLLYRDEAAKAGRKLALGQSMCCGQYMSIGRDREDALQRAQASNTATYYRDFGGPFGFWEAFRFAEDEAKYPAGKVMLPPSEWTLERLERKGHLVAGSPAEIRAYLDRLVAESNPEFLQFSVSQGFLPLEETIRQLRIYGEQIMPYYM